MTTALHNMRPCRTFGDRPERGSSDLIFIMALLLLSALINRSSQQLNLSTLLMQNQVLAQRASRLARNRAIENFQPLLSMPERSGLQCSQGTASAGPVSRTVYRCDYFPESNAPARSAVNYDLLFSMGPACSLRNVKRLTPPDWSYRSIYDCAVPEKPLTPSLILNGDLFMTEEIKLPAADENLIAVRGSFRVSSLTLRSNLTLISLGDISIPTITADSAIPLHLLILAPLGTVTIESSRGPVRVTATSRSDRITPGIPRLPARASRFLVPLAFLPLGLFNRSLTNLP